MKNFNLAALIFTAALASSLFSSFSLAKNAATELETLLNNLTSLSAKFEQITQDGRGLKIQQASGITHLAKPKLFYWQTQEPYEQLIVSNGELMWVYEPDLEQVTEQPLDEQAEQTPAFLLINQAENLEQHFAIQQQTQGKQQIFTLKPLNTSSLFEQLKLSFINQQIASLELIDSLGQKTLIRLQVTASNQPIDKQIFNFTPPDGVDLIQQAH